MRSHPLWEHGFAILLLGAVVTIVVLGIAGSMVTGSETVSVKSEVFSNLNSEGSYHGARDSRCAEPDAADAGETSSSRSLSMR